MNPRLSSQSSMQPEHSHSAVASDDFVRDVAEGLAASQKYLKPRYFYDERGSRLFEHICVQPEYYLTRTETDILRACCREIVSATCDGARQINVIELGSGSSIKTRILFRALLASTHKFRINYIPIDISRSALVESANLISEDFPELEVRQIVADYASGLEMASRALGAKRPAARAERKIVLFLGSSIGNMDEAESRGFLSMLRDSIGEQDSLLVGFDLEKDKAVLEKAYDDSACITALFNLNILERINRELGGHFDVSSFSHKAVYNDSKHRIEMHLVSERDQTVRIDVVGRDYYFASGESIHTENSHKYSIERIESLTSRCGLKVKYHYTDDKNWYDLCLLERAA